MLKSISLENYKCFKEKTDIDIAPLTVLCGVNSSGKSSILKSLLMLKQSYENTLSFNELTFNGKYVDNGFFKDIVYQKQGNSFIIKNTFEIIRPSKQKIHGVSEADATTFNELLKIFKKYEFDLHCKIDCFKISIELSVCGLTSTEEISKKLKNSISNYDVFISLMQKENNELKPILKNDIHILLHKSETVKKNYFGRIYDVIIENMPYDVGSETKIFSDSIPSCSCYFEGVKLVKLYKANPDIDNISMILPNLYSIFRIISYQYKNIKHISPLRTMPNRRYIFDENVNSTGMGGEFTAQTLYCYKDRNIVFYEPPENNILSFNHTKCDTLMNAAKLWGNYLGIGDISVEQFEEMLKLNISQENIVDVGFGISQGLPVIISGLLLKNAETLLLEQPEIHLHPNMQMKMADFLITQAYNNKNLIVETHSDHIINRITRRVMEDKTGTLRKKIKIYFVQGYDIDNPIYSGIDFDPIDGLVNAPDEFFTQFGSEVMYITKTGMMNAKEGIKW